jgi:hypothetical protein
MACLIDRPDAHAEHARGHGPPTVTPATQPNSSHHPSPSKIDAMINHRADITLFILGFFH